MRIRLTILLIFTPIIICSAQEGSWNPPLADHSHPRSIMEKGEIVHIRDSIKTYPLLRKLYKAVYNNSLTTPPDVHQGGNRMVHSNICKDAAFVRIINRQIEGKALNYFTLQQQNEITNKGITMLEELDPSVQEASTSYTDWIWRSAELINYLIAYDLLKGAGISDNALDSARKNLKIFAGNLHKEATRSYAGLDFFNLTRNNISLRTSSALGMAGVILNNADSSDSNYQAQKWINTGMWNVYNTLWVASDRQSDSTKFSGYAEGPYYFKFSLQNMLPFFKAYNHFLPDGVIKYSYKGSTYSIRNPWHDPKYDSLYRWLTAITMPDGRIPALGDSYINYGTPELVQLEKQNFSYPLNLNYPVESYNSYSSQLALSCDYRPEFISSFKKQQYPEHSVVTCFPKAGNLVFRSSKDSNVVYMHVSGEHGRARRDEGGHNQADVGSFIIHAYGELLAIDPGYINYDRRNEVGNAQNHNMVLVNGNGPEIGSPGNANGANGYLKNPVELNSIGYGELETQYKNSDINRKYLFVDKKFFIIGDLVESNNYNDYQWQLHGMGVNNKNVEGGIFNKNTSKNKASWQIDGVSLSSVVASNNSAPDFSSSKMVHELNWDSTSKHNRFIARKEDIQKAQFTSALYPYKNKAPILNAVKNSKAATVTGSYDSSNFVSFSQDTTKIRTFSPSKSNLKYTFKANGRFSFIKTNQKSKEAETFLISQGNKMSYHGKTLFKADTNGLFAFEKKDSTAYKGYSGQQGTYKLHLKYYPEEIAGNHIDKWTFDSSTSLLSLKFSRESYFKIKTTTKRTDSINTGVRINNFKNPVLLYPNPANHYFSIQSKHFAPPIEKVRLFTNTGKVIRKVSVNGDQEKVKIDTENLQSGIYIAEIIMNHYSLKKRIVVY